MEASADGKADAAALDVDDKVTRPSGLAERGHFDATLLPGPDDEIRPRSRPSGSES